MTNKRNVLSLLVVGLLIASLTACYYPVRGGVRVGFGPPEFRAEVALASPGPGYYWVPGYYDWNGGRYAWVAGSWARPPHERAVWVAPRYERRGRGWYYHRGFWR